MRRRRNAAIVDITTGELRGVKLRMAPVEVVECSAALPGPVRAVYEAGPTGFGLARAGVARAGCARGGRGQGPARRGERIKTDKRDAERLARLLAAGECGSRSCPAWRMSSSGTSSGDRGLPRRSHAAPPPRVEAAAAPRHPLGGPWVDADAHALAAQPAL
jgi:hypothetical protein